MKLTFFGAAQRTTGSKYLLLEVNHHRLLLECGMYQGRREKTILYNTQMPFAPGDISALVLSHAHIDHSGITPVVCRDGFKGPIYCTDATADLCRYMLLDSAHIQEQDAIFLNKKRAKKGLPPVQPLYDQTHAIAALQQFVPLRYATPTEILEGVTVTFLEAGHILGSAVVVLDLEENGRRVRLAFSGDLGRGHNELLRDPDVPSNVDCLMIESTYGNREHEPTAHANERLCQIILRTVENRGKLIIPSFAVGRTQQILYSLSQLFQNRCIPPVKVFVDSPLAINATAVFRAHLECFNDNFRALMENGPNPFAMPNLIYISTVEQSMELNHLDEPCIIISASGMAEAGRVRHHIRNNIENPRSTILIVGWCAAHTLGGHLASGEKQVNIFGEPYRVRCHVEVINAFSGHADRTELRNWSSRLNGTLRKIFVVHGEPEPSQTFASILRQMLPESHVHVPEFGDTVEL
ncbi:MAG: MBL fold metallo-hydrolase [Verrucomicrobiae bacterium]|nr:MBL fold metallo-hydrolase [Verrucomicrobiae bacterium]